MIQHKNRFITSHFNYNQARNQLLAFHCWRVAVHIKECKGLCTDVLLLYILYFTHVHSPADFGIKLQYVSYKNTSYSW